MTQESPESLSSLVTGRSRRWGLALLVLAAAGVVLATIWIGEVMLSAVERRRDQALERAVGLSIEEAVRDFEADVSASDRPETHPPGEVGNDQDHPVTPQRDAAEQIEEDDVEESR
jgi:hypothetical protein